MVDTVWLNDKTWLDREGACATARICTWWNNCCSIVNAHVLQDDLTIMDPKAFTKPWKTTIPFELRPDWEIIKRYTCADQRKLR